MPCHLQRLTYDQWTYDQWSFSPVTIGFSTQQSNPDANICAMCSNYLARGYQGLHVKQTNKKLFTKMFILCLKVFVYYIMGIKMLINTLKCQLQA